jgi:hypothetical protein
MADYKFQEVCTTFYTGIIGSIARKLSDPTFMASLSGKNAQQIGQLIHEAAGIPIAVAHNSRITGSGPTTEVLRRPMNYKVEHGNVYKPC